MYVAYAVGGPSAYGSFNHWNFLILMLLCMALPGLGFILTCGLRHVPPSQGERRAFFSILSTIKWHGAGVRVARCRVRRAGAYIALAFHHRHWDHGGLGLTFFGLAFVTNRLLIGSTPDRFGGLPIALGRFCLKLPGSPVFLSPRRPSWRFFRCGAGRGGLFDGLSRFGA